MRCVRMCSGLQRRTFYDAHEQRARGMGRGGEGGRFLIFITLF
jgi:hypothetical protein